MIDAAREPFSQATAASPARYYAWLYARADQRADIELVLALEHELAHSVRPGADHSVAHARIEWWHAEAARARSRTAAHPLTKAIAERLAARALPPLDLRDFVTTLEWDLAGAPLATQDEVMHYARAWSSAIFQPLAALALGAPSPAPLAAAGAALRELEALAWATNDPPLLALRVAGDRLAAAGLQRTDLEQRPLASAASAFLGKAMESARATLGSACVALNAAEQAALRPLLVWAYVAVDATRSALAAPKTPTRWHALGLPLRAWRAALRANAGKFSLPAC